MSENSEDNKEVLIAVPEKWFKSLLEIALDFEKSWKEYEYGNPKNDKILHKGLMLMGYAKSSSTIIKHNKRVK
jgi:hypothetical protein